MTSPIQPLRHVSDTARWVAMYRAREAQRPEPLFFDPYAARLAGEDGPRIVQQLGSQDKNEWAFIVRTYLFDRAIERGIADGADMVLSLGAGLDARPYRLELAHSLVWVEIDLPGIMDYKESVLRNETPACALERIPLDLSNEEARQTVFDRLGERADRVLIACEGLMAYLTTEQVATLATDLAAPRNFERLVIDLASPGLLRMIKKQIGDAFADFHAPMEFAPEEGPGFFRRYGWEPIDVQSMFKHAARLKRIGWVMRLLALLPESSEKQGSSPWSGVCTFSRAAGRRT